MNAAEVTSLLAAVNVTLRPHQLRILESEARVIIVQGDPCTGKTFSVVPWLLSLEPGKLHGIVSPSMREATVGPLLNIFRILQKLRIESVFGKEPPRSWKAPGIRLPAGLTKWRDVLTLRTGATVNVLSLNSELRHRKFASVFIDAAATEEERGTVADIVKRSERAVVTTYNAMAMVAAIPEGGEVLAAWQRDLVVPPMYAVQT